MENEMTPFDKSFKAQYELALRVGNQRFGSECKHEKVYAGRCCDCLRRVITKKIKPNPSPSRKDEK